jgi:hypothetical protein
MTKTRNQNRSAFFRPAKELLSEDEKLCIRALWNTSHEEIREELSAQLEREPTQLEIRRLFNRFIKIMKKEGHIQYMIDECQKWRLSKQANEQSSDTDDTQESKMEVEPKDSQSAPSLPTPTPK